MTNTAEALPSDFGSAITDLQSRFGPAVVSQSSEDLGSYSRATFETTQRVLAVIRPRNVAELREIVLRSAQLQVPLYPVSGGRNWGLGSRVPVADQCCVVDLAGLNAIREFREDLGYVVVEAGVTFAQLFEFMRQRQSTLFLAAIGGPPEASIIGNAVERGDGVGPHGDRASQITSLEVVLPSGELLKTGFGAFCSSAAAHISRHAPGMELEGLFFQSGLGIVTAATVWLRRKPNCYQSVLFTLDQQSQLKPMIDSIRALQEQGVIKPNSFALWNTYKFLAGQGACPWQELSGTQINEAELRKKFPRFWRKTKWLGFVALYSASRTHGFIEQRLVTRALRSKVKRLLVLNGLTARLLTLARPIVRRLSGFDPAPIVHSFFRSPVALGVPTRMNTASMYWRKQERPQEMEPHRDRCGLYWLCHIVPFAASEIEVLDGLISEACFRSGFEPNIALLNYSERCLRLFALISYDRDVPGEDARARAVAEELHSKLQTHGLPAYRLGIGFMDKMKPECGTYETLSRELKQALDPHGIMSPGRYELWKQQVRTKEDR